MNLCQGRRRLLKSGPAMKYQRHLTSAKYQRHLTSGGEHERGYEKGKISYFWTSIETILMHFRTTFALEALLIL